MRPLLFFVSVLLIVNAESASCQTWKDLLNTAESLLKAQKPDSAIAVGNRALQSAESQFGNVDTNVAQVLHRLGFFYRQNADFATAMNLYKRALIIREKLLPPNHPDVAASVSVLGIVYRRLGQFDEARPLFEKSLRLRELAFGPEHREVAVSLTNLALLQQDLGNQQEAERILLRTLRILNNNPEKNQGDIATTLDNLGSAYLLQGKLSDAESCFERGLHIREKMGTGDLPASLNNLGLVHMNMGWYDKAEQELRRAIAIIEKSLGADHYRIASPLGNMGKLYREQGNVVAATPWDERALTVVKKHLPPTDLGRVLHTVNHVYNLTDLGKYSEAEELLQDAVKAIASSETESRTMPYLLTAYAELRMGEGRLAEAESLFQQALAVSQRALPPHHPDLARTYLRASKAYRTHGNAFGAWILARTGFIIRLHGFFDESLGMSEKHRSDYSIHIERAIDDATSAYIELPSIPDSVRGQIAEIILSGKGIVTEGYLNQQSIREIEQTPAAQSLFDAVRTTKLEISTLYAKGTSRASIDSLQNHADSLESQLARVSSAYREQVAMRSISTKDIAARLPANSILIDYLRVGIIARKGNTSAYQYIVLILDNDGNPTVANLGDANRIDNLVGIYRKHHAAFALAKSPPSQSDQRKVSEISKQIFKLILRPIAARIKPGSTLFIAPDGGLNLISFAGLMDEKGKYLIEKYPIHYLSAGRDLIRINQDSTASGAGLLALGDPDYDASVATRVSSGKDVTFIKASSGNSTDVYAVRNVRSGCGTLSEMKVGRLAQTRPEVEAIAQSWTKENKSEEAIVHLGAKASEEEFKRNASGKRIVHLATHGYFLEGECGKDTSRRDVSAFAGENPLLLSGLFLAGANLHGKGADTANAEDGIVTALEVSSMDLRGADLVVLSACETGLGKVEQGEGVYGLRRAFQMAGAKTVVSSLWQVPDAETAKFMKALYANMNHAVGRHAMSPLTYPELMQKVALERIRELRLRGRPTHPFTWGAFVATGEWRIKP
ncbi:MAG: CHAT domain-containing protein [Ignavibacteriae bacterium]|nr:CHAT domain-containing protein [Ignavibacteriota bacterium]